MAANNTSEHRADVALQDNERTDKPIRFKATKNIYWEDWGHMRLVFVAGRIYDGVKHSSGNVSGYSPYYDVSDVLSNGEYEIVEG